MRRRCAQAPTFTKMSQAFRSLVEIKIPELDLTTETPLELEIAAVQGGTANLILPLFSRVLA